MLAGIIFGLGTGALWGFAFIAPRVLSGVSAELVALGRFGFYAIFSAGMLLVYWNQAKRHWVSSILLKALLLTILGNSLYYILLIEAIRASGVALASVIVGALPVTIALIGAGSFNKIRKLLLPLFLITLGTIVVKWKEFGQALSGTPSPEYVLGVTLAVTAHVCWLFFALFNTRFLKQRPDVDAKIWSSLLGIGSMLTLVLYLAVRAAFLSPMSLGVMWNTHFLFWTAIVGVGSSWIALWFWNEASRRLSTPLLGQLIVSETVFAIVYECIYESRFVSKYESLALLFLCIGVSLAIRAETAK
ncbi:MAG: DMT family transporter [Deltaproteobacteria bacterium]|nr:DMT family transporter [Deltaproteobacteria bacterium]